MIEEMNVLSALDLTDLFTTVEDVKSDMRSKSLEVFLDKPLKGFLMDKGVSLEAQVIGIEMKLAKLMDAMERLRDFQKRFAQQYRCRYFYLLFIDSPKCRGKRKRGYGERFPIPLQHITVTFRGWAWRVNKSLADKCQHPKIHTGLTVNIFSNDEPEIMAAIQEATRDMPDEYRAILRVMDQVRISVNSAIKTLQYLGEAALREYAQTDDRIRAEFNEHNRAKAAALIMNCDPSGETLKLLETLGTLAEYKPALQRN